MRRIAYQHATARPVLGGRACWIILGAGIGAALSAAFAPVFIAWLLATFG